MNPAMILIKISTPLTNIIINVDIPKIAIIKPTTIHQKNALSVSSAITPNKGDIGNTKMIMLIIKIHAIISKVMFSSHWFSLFSWFPYSTNLSSISFNNGFLSNSLKEIEPSIL